MNNMPIETVDVGLGNVSPLTNIVMPPYSGDIGIEELSPTLQRLILEGNGTGGGSTIAEPTSLVVRDIVTRKVVAETQDQKVFTIPFEDFETANCHLDIKINSTWINPDRYSVVGNQLTLIDGVDIGKAVYFTCYYLSEVTGDGGFIQDVDVAETPQEVIVYDGSIIDEKVNAHSSSATAHADIRELINGNVNRVNVLENDRGYLNSKVIVNTSANTLTKNGVYAVDGMTCTDLPVQNQWVYIRVYTNSDIYLVQEATVLSGAFKYVRCCFNGTWDGWKQVATTDITTAISDKVNWKPNDWKTEADAPSTYGGQTTTVFHNSANAFNGKTQGIVMTRCFNGSLAYQEISFLNDRTTSKFYRVAIRDTDTWSAWKEIATTDSAMTKFPLLRTGDLKEYIKGLEQSCTFYVHADCTNTPIEGKFFICQVFCQINGANYSDKHITLQEFSTKRQFFGDSWNKENIVWKEYAQIETVTLNLLNGWVDAFDSSTTIKINKVGNIVSGSISLKGGTFADDTPICTLPVGWRPKQHAFSGTHSGTDWSIKPCACNVWTNGTVVARGLTGSNRLNLSFSFPV